MKNQDEHLEALNDIRNIMQRSTRFSSLSGLSGIIIGLIALTGAAAAWWYMNLSYSGISYDMQSTRENYGTSNLTVFLIVDALLVLIFSIMVAFIFTINRSRKIGEKFWNPVFKRFLFNLFVPLVTGGVFCIILIYHGIIGMTAPTTLIFYGLALFSSSKYTLNEIKYLGLCEITLGLMASFFIGNGLVFWALGFGVLHVLYGIIMYYRYENATTN